MFFLFFFIEKTIKKSFRETFGDLSNIFSDVFKVLERWRSDFVFSCFDLEDVPEIANI